MKIEQVYQFVNTATQEVLGDSAVVQEDLSNIVDIGDSIQNALGTEKFYGSLVNQIGRMLFVTRPYKGKYLSMFRDAWEFGSIVGKVQADLMDATEDEQWQIVNGASYDPYVVNLPVVTAKFFNKAVAFEIDITTPVDQIKQSFKSAEEMDRFLSMLEVQVNNSMELKMEALAQRAVNNMVGATIVGNNGARVVKLLTEYNTLAGTSLTANDCLIDAGFLRYAVGRFLDYKGYLSEYSELYNEGGKARHTPADKLHFVCFNTFASRCKTHLQSLTFHEELVKLPYYEEISKWQGTGTGGSISDRAKIYADVTLPDGTTGTCNQGAIVAVMFDHDALGILQPKKEVDVAYNPKGKYFNSFHRWHSRYFCDFQENAVVFLLA